MDNAVAPNTLPVPSNLHRRMRGIKQCTPTLYTHATRSIYSNASRTCLMLCSSTTFAIIITLSRARIFVQINTRICRSSGVVVCNSFRTYGNIPTDKAYEEVFLKSTLKLVGCMSNVKRKINSTIITRSTAQGPMSRNLPRRTSARNR